MKNKIWSILLGALLLLTMLPMCGMAIADEPAVSNLILNGDFEDAFTSAGMPAANWGIYYGNKSATPGGVISAVESDTFGTENPVTINPASGSKFLKIEKNVATEADNTTETRVDVYFPVSEATGFETGKRYQIEAYVYIPESIESVFLGSPSSLSGTGFQLGAFNGIISGATDGWKKFVDDFIFTGTTHYIKLAIKGIQTGVVYLDGVKAVELKDTNTLIHEHNDSKSANFNGHFNFGQDLTLFSTGSSSSFGDAYAIKADPANPSDSALFIPDQKIISKTNNTATPVKFLLDASKISGYTINDAFKFTYRIKVVASATPEADINVPVYIYNVLSDASRKTVTPTLLIPKDKVNQWVDVEIITTAYNTLDSYYGFQRLAGYDYYVDDFDAVPVSASYISDLCVFGNSSIIRAGSTADNRIWVNAVTGIRGGEYGKTNTVKPLMFFLPDSSLNKAIGIVALYKIEGTTRTLVDVGVETLSRKTLAELTTTGNRLVPEEIGFASNVFGTALSDFDLTEGTYQVECFMLNLSGLSSVANNVVFNVK